MKCRWMRGALGACGFLAFIVLSACTTNATSHPAAQAAVTEKSATQDKPVYWMYRFQPPKQKAISQRGESARRASMVDPSSCKRNIPVLPG